MNDVKVAHPEADQLLAFAQGRLDEAQLAALAFHLNGCAACRDQVEASGDDTLISLLRAADTEHDGQEAADARQMATLAGPTPAQKLSSLPTDLAEHSRYRVQELLGVGGMGAVYKAEHLLMERRVALKLISHTLTSDPAMVERFRREVKSAARLKHPNIVMAYDAEQAGDSHFLVMEYVEGQSLARLVAEQGPLPVRQACDYIRQAALGLQHAHERGMVHRDIKPQNLMLTPDGQTKILDFGLARFAMETAPSGALGLVTAANASAASALSSGSLTQIGTVMGTPDYIAPEQVTDAHTADIRADIYSLGCTLYDLLAGHAPFPEGSAISKIKAHSESTPKPLTELRRDVPAELARVVERMMAKDPGRRYQTPAEVALALTPFAAGTPAKPRWRWALAAAAAMLVISAGYFAPTIYRIVMNEGTLIVEVDDPQVEVVLKGAAVEVVDRANKRTYLVSKGGNQLKAGAYDLQVKDATGMEIFTKEFKITRNDRTAVRITLAGEQRGAAVAARDQRKLREKDRQGGGIPFEFLAQEGRTAMRLRSLTLVFQALADSKVPRAIGELAIPLPGMTMRSAGPSTFDGFPVQQGVVNGVNTITAAGCPMKLVDFGDALEIAGKRFEVYGQAQTIRIRPDGTLAAEEANVAETIDHRLIQGAWRAMAATARGQRIKDDEVKLMAVTFTGDTIELVEPEKIGKGSFGIDPTKSPKQITLRYEEGGKQMVSQGVYSLDAETLRLHIGAPNEGPINHFGGTAGMDITLSRDRAKLRNPFGVLDVEEPDGADVRAFGKRRGLPGGPDDANAEAWVTRATKGEPGSLDGEWLGREKDEEAGWEYCKDRVQIKSGGDRVFILFSDHEGKWLVEARREKNRLIGCIQGVDQRRDWRAPCLLVIVGPERIDGEIDNGGRIDFRRKLD
jgi:uncharacterized protein (TIGR03067 family)